MSTTLDDPLALVQSFVDCVCRADLEGLEGLLADDHLFVDALGQEMRGREAMAEAWRGYFGLVPDYRIEVEQTFVQGESLVLLGRASGSYSPDGVRVAPRSAWSTPAAWLAIVRGDRLVRWQVWADNEPLRAQMRRSPPRATGGRGGRREALLVLDLQRGIFDLPRPLHDGQGFLARVTGLVSRARREGRHLVFVRTLGPPGSRFAAGCPGAEIHPALDFRRGDRVVVKTEPDAFTGGSLDKLLREHGVDTLRVCGFATEGCIDTTVRSAYARGYRVLLVADAHSTTDSEVLPAERIIAHHNDVLARFAELVLAGQG